MDNTETATVALVGIDGVKVEVTFDHAINHNREAIASALLREVFTGQDSMSSKIFKTALRKGIEAACFCCATQYCLKKGVPPMPYKIEIL